MKNFRIVLLVALALTVSLGNAFAENFDLGGWVNGALSGGWISNPIGSVSSVGNSLYSSAVSMGSSAYSSINRASGGWVGGALSGGWINDYSRSLSSTLSLSSLTASLNLSTNSLTNKSAAPSLVSLSSLGVSKTAAPSLVSLSSLGSSKSAAPSLVSLKSLGAPLNLPRPSLVRTNVLRSGFGGGGRSRR